MAQKKRSKGKKRKSAYSEINPRHDDLPSHPPPLDYDTSGDEDLPSEEQEYEGSKKSPEEEEEAYEGEERRTSERRRPRNILQTAEKLIYGERNKVYKHPTDNFSNIANLWNAYFEAIIDRPEVYDDINQRFKINKIDVAYMNILQKVARGATNQEHVDTIVDVAGYAGCIERIIKDV